MEANFDTHGDELSELEFSILHGNQRYVLLSETLPPPLNDDLQLRPSNYALPAASELN